MALERVIAKFELQINVEKTKILELLDNVQFQDFGSGVVCYLRVKCYLSAFL